MKARWEQLNILVASLEAVNALWGDPSIRIVDEFLDVVARYGTPEEINRQHQAARSQENLLALVRERNAEYLRDLEWLQEQRDRRAFLSIADYRRKVLGPKAESMSFKDAYAVTLEVSALQYFPWIRAMCEQQF
ncbi:MAG: hypothetical protein ACK4VW_09205 [Anaerolineales bacterium]